MCDGLEAHLGITIQPPLGPSPSLCFIPIYLVEHCAHSYQARLHHHATTHSHTHTHMRRPPLHTLRPPHYLLCAFFSVEVEENELEHLAFVVCGVCVVAVRSLPVRAL
jgi:hypothetical protein